MNRELQLAMERTEWYQSSGSVCLKNKGKKSYRKRGIREKGSQSIFGYIKSQEGSNGKGKKKWVGWAHASENCIKGTHTR